jgi:hypothetical protein
MVKLVLEIPEGVQTALRFPPSEMERELRRELALALYQQRALPFGKARELGQMTRVKREMQKTSPQTSAVGRSEWR